MWSMSQKHATADSRWVSRGFPDAPSLTDHSVYYESTLEYLIIAQYGISAQGRDNSEFVVGSGEQLNSNQYS